MGASMERVSAASNNEVGISRFLLVARGATVAVSTVTAVFHIEPPFGPASFPLLLGLLLLYNLTAAIAALAFRRSRSEQLRPIVVADVVAMSILVGITGAYDSAYFAMLLFVMVESSVYFNWRTASAVIVTINGVQVVATALHVATHEKTQAFYPVESRFLLLLVVGFLFVILAESMRREERARRAADRASAQTANLNSIFSQMGNAHLDISRVFETVFASAESVGAVLFSAILQRSALDMDWRVAASSNGELCPMGRALHGGAPRRPESDPTTGPRIATGREIEAFAPCAAAAGCSQLLMYEMPAYSDDEEGMLLVARSDDRPLGDEDTAFLRALSMQAQLAIHNALLYRRQERQFERLRSFKEMQDAFFTAAAHELKTPLTVLGVLTSTLRMTVARPSPAQEEMFTTIEQNIHRMQTHTANLLAAARLEADDVVLHRRRVDPRRVALRSVEALRAVLLDGDVAVDLLPQASWHEVVADPDRLGEVFGNLLSNAAKFAPSGSRVTIGCRGEEDRDIFSVCNSGAGVPDDERVRIFEKSYTSREAGARAGSGLGLYIVKELVALHGGEVWVDSTPGSVCFWFSLPRVDESEIA